MKKIAITALMMGIISISVLHAQSDFGPKKHHKRIPIQSQNELNNPKTLAAYSLPFTQGFESGIPPTDWDSFIGVNGVGDTYNWQTYGYGYSGSCALVYWDDPDGQYSEDWLVTPQITLGENSSMTFYERQGYNFDYGSTFYVKISTNSQNVHSDFIDLVNYDEGDFTNSWSSRTIDLSAYDGQDVYLAFVMINDDGDAWLIDNVNIIDDPGGGGTAGGELIISEISYPTDSDGEKGRFVELYNSSDTDIDLNDYYLAFYKRNQRINLSSTIAAGETFIYAPDNTDFYSSYGFYPHQADGGINSSWFNGTDAILLLEKVGGNYQIRDAYGVKKVNGDGKEWDYEGMHAVRYLGITEQQNNFQIEEWHISSAYYYYRDVTPGNHNDIYYWSGSYNDEWDDYRNWTVNTGFQAIPDAGSNVIIPSGTSNTASLGAYNFPYFFNSLTVRSGASFTLKSYNILRVINDVSIESEANIYVESDINGAAAFIPEGNVNGEINIERWFPSIGGTTTNGEWHYFSPSITNLSSNVFMDQYLMYWDEPTTYWQYITETNYNLIPGLGYGVLLQNEFGNTLNFSGTIVNGDIESPVLNSTDGSGWQGWNLIGNPYTASLDWEQIVSDLPNGVDVGIHYWDGENDQYVFYNNGNGTATQYIPPMQGFFIHTNSDGAQFTLAASARTYNGQDVYYKSGEGKPYQIKTNTPREHNNRLIISSISEFGKTDKAFLEFHPKASENFDFDFDSKKFNSSNDSIPEPYILYNSINYAINTLPEESIEGRFDLCINYGQNASYTLNFSDLESFSESQPIILHDKFTGEYYDLRENNNIGFYNDSNAPENRFEIVLDNWLEVEELNPSYWLVYSVNGNLNIRNNIRKSNETIYYQIISIDGKMIDKGQFNTELVNKSFELPHSMYIVKLIDNDSQTVHKVLLHP